MMVWLFGRLYTQCLEALVLRIVRWNHKRKKSNGAAAWVK